VLAFAQIGAHLAFFLHLGSGPDNTNNILALAFRLLIVFLLITGSCWIIANLNANMMPMSVNMPRCPPSARNSATRRAASSE
jgi:cytochrome o ubiquinol oxidase subunit IV